MKPGPRYALLCIGCAGFISLALPIHAQDKGFATPRAGNCFDNACSTNPGVLPPSGGTLSAQAIASAGTYTISGASLLGESLIVLKTVTCRLVILKDDDMKIEIGCRKDFGK